ncbi:unnamed protein product, partial [Darwinula stevensoni]
TKKVLFLREVVPLKGDEAFSALLDSLRKRGHNNLANSLSKEKAALTPSIPQGAAGKPYRATTPASQYSEAQDLNLERPREEKTHGAPEANQRGGFTGYMHQFQQLLRRRYGFIMAFLAVLAGIGMYRIGEDLKTWDKIRANRRKLRDEYNVDGEELLRCLSDRNVFTAPEEKQIRSKENPKLLYDELFEILLHKNPQKYAPVFLDALTVIGRQDVRDFLLSEVGEMPA